MKSKCLRLFLVLTSLVISSSFSAQKATVESKVQALLVKQQLLDEQQPNNFLEKANIHQQLMIIIAELNSTAATSDRAQQALWQSLIPLVRFKPAALAMQAAIQAAESENPALKQQLKSHLEQLGFYKGWEYDYTIDHKSLLSYRDNWHANAQLPSMGSDKALDKKWREPITLLLVRHAEKQKVKANPGLTQAGHARAQRFAKIVIVLTRSQNKALKLYSTNYKRTLETIAPTERALDLPVSHYDPRQLSAFASSLLEELISSQRSAVVVGHSNTTDRLAYLLGGFPGPAIDHEEYDRYYQLIVYPNGLIETRLGSTENHTENPIVHANQP